MLHIYNNHLLPLNSECNAAIPFQIESQSRRFLRDQLELQFSTLATL